MNQAVGHPRRIQSRNVGRLTDRRRARLHQVADRPMLSLELVQECVKAMNPEHGAGDQVHAQQDQTRAEHQQGCEQVHHLGERVVPGGGDQDAEHAERKSKHRNPRAQRGERSAFLGENQLSLTDGEGAALARSGRRSGSRCWYGHASACPWNVGRGSTPRKRVGIGPGRLGGKVQYPAW